MRTLVALLVAALLASGCAAASNPATAGGDGTPVRIGAGSDAESRLLAHVARSLLAAQDIDAQIAPYATLREARQALELEDLDVLPGYTAAVWLDALGRADPPSDPRESFRRVSRADARNGIIWLEPTFGERRGLDTPPADATFAFFVRGIPSQDAALANISQLATRLGEDPGERLCVDPVFARREDGLPAVQRAYAIRDRIEVLGVSPENTVRGVAAGDCLAGMATATDGEAWASHLRPLADDLGVFPAFVVSLQVTETLAGRRPQVVRALRPLPGHLTTRMLGLWNARVASGMPVERVAAQAAEVLLRRAEQASPPASPTPANG